jgi:hypothetical protein
MSRVTEQFTFAGANIKGTPSMPRRKVRHDLKKLKRRADVFGVQEFTWTWYWKAATALLAAVWGSVPSFSKGVARPILGAQGIFWKRKLFKRLDSFIQPSFDFRVDTSGIMNDRWLRAVLLKVRSHAFAGWFLSGHFVVGGDEDGDGPVRKELLAQNIAYLDRALTELLATGYPVMAELDCNIHRGTWAYARLMDVLEKHGATVHGTHGVEFSFTCPAAKGRFIRVKASNIPTSELETDHEVRVLDWVGSASQW